MLKRESETIKGRGGVDREVITGADHLYIWIPQFSEALTLNLEDEMWFQDISKHLSGVVYLPTQSDAERHEIAKLMEDHRTFTEVLDDPKTSQFLKSYVNDVFDGYYNAMDKVIL